jgi:hypothetical protein
LQGGTSGSVPPGKQDLPRGPRVTNLPAAAGCTASFFNFVRETINSRRRMVQLATVGLCIGLFIMMRK